MAGSYDGVCLLSFFAIAINSAAGFSSPLMPAVHHNFFTLRVSPQHKLRPNPNFFSRVRASFDGNDEVKWLPAPGPIPASDPSPGSFVIPVVPLGPPVHLPTRKPTLTISQPRYCQLYDDILLSGSKRFAVCTVDSDTGRFSEVATILCLKELKEVSEQTGDSVKYVCDHEVIGRVKLTKVLNPSAWIDASTYLKAEAIEIHDTVEPEAESKAAEEAFRATFRQLVNTQHELSEPVRFSRMAVDIMDLSLKSGLLWNAVDMWKTFQEQRLLRKQLQMQKEFQEKLKEHLRNANGGKMPNGGRPLPPSVIRIQDLPPQLQNEAKDLQERIQNNLGPLGAEDRDGLLLILQAPTHSARVRQLDRMAAVELRRLAAKQALRSAFGP